MQALALTASDHVLDVGGASGYSAALLARLAGSVVALEEDAEFVPIATRLLASLGAAHAKVVSGPLTAGWPKEGPYDAILLQGSVEIVPAALTDSLKDGGRLAAVIGSGRAAKAMLYLRTGKVVGSPARFRCGDPAFAGLFRTPRIRVLTANSTPVAILPRGPEIAAMRRYAVSSPAGADYPALRRGNNESRPDFNPVGRERLNARA